MKQNTILNTAMIVTAVPSVLKIAIENRISPENVFSLLLITVFFIAGGKPVIKFAAAIGGLALFAKEVTGNDPAAETAIFSSLAILSIMLIGYYVMFRGIFGGKRKQSEE